MRSRYTECCLIIAALALACGDDKDHHEDENTSFFQDLETMLTGRTLWTAEGRVARTVRATVDIDNLPLTDGPKAQFIIDTGKVGDKDPGDAFEVALRPFIIDQPSRRRADAPLTHRACEAAQLLTIVFDTSFTLSIPGQQSPGLNLSCTRATRTSTNADVQHTIRIVVSGGTTQLDGTVSAMLQTTRGRVGASASSATGPTASINLVRTDVAVNDYEGTVVWLVADNDLADARLSATVRTIGATLRLSGASAPGECGQADAAIEMCEN